MGWLDLLNSLFKPQPSPISVPDPPVIEPIVQPDLVTIKQLHSIMPSLSILKGNEYLPFINSALREFSIDTPLRIAAFLAQIAHESVELRYFYEIWGPTPVQLRYEGRIDLGNTKPGMGYTYRGRGPIQITGFNGYSLYGHKLGLDLINNPDLAATPQVGFRIAGLYWQDHGLNTLADNKDFTSITKKINGGLNGLSNRLIYYNKAILVLNA